MIKERLFPRNNSAYINRNNSLLSLAKFSGKVEKAVKTEKEFESIAEESSVQFIQSSFLKRDKSAETIITIKRESSIPKIEVAKIESDLSSLRKQYLSIVEEKVKVEKDIISCKTKIKNLEDQTIADKALIEHLENSLKKCQHFERKFIEVSEKLKESNVKLKDFSELISKAKEESARLQTLYEEKFAKLARELVVTKQQLISKDELCLKLQFELKSLRKVSGDKCKNLSPILSSKDRTPDSTAKLRLLENSYTILQEQYKITSNKNKDLSDFFDSITSLMRPDIHQMPEQSITALQNKIESLEAKLDLFQTSPDFLPFLQCQASIIETYLKEDEEINRINSSLSSF